ncbi:hypothetical protein RJT34_11814 [Clitoria ternatea]|uniref:Uncharacterized protein n=1 Tax=Clitoria ternatea TaxID=43366 RepID=A0AAN9JMR3_CLITE
MVIADLELTAIEAICNCNLSSLDYLEGNYFEMATYFAVDFPSQDEFGNQYPLLLRVTKFLCGGYILALSMSHTICDGTGASKFLHALADLANGTKTEPLLKPV